MTAPSPADKKPRRWFAPRFSLRMLLLAVTAAAVGAAFWWRWPVTQVTERKGGPSVIKETFTYHRGLTGNLIKHGVHRITRDGKLELEEFYREGLQHGPYRLNGVMGTVTGDYYLGKKDGTWKYVAAEYLPPEQRLSAEERWSRGKRELTKRWDHTGKLLYGLQFVNDRLVGAENCLSASLVAQRIAEGTLDDKKAVGKRQGPNGTFKHWTLVDALLSDVDLDYPETPLGEVIEDLRERFAFPIAARWRRATVEVPPPSQPVDPPLPAMHEIPFSKDWILVEPDDPTAARHLVDMRPRNLPPPAPAIPPPPIVMEVHLAPVRVNEKQIPFLAGFDAILSPLGLALDYRFGVLCVVDAERAADWKDSTGVMDLKPAPGTPLAARLDEPPEPTGRQHVWWVLRHLKAEQGIEAELRFPSGHRVNLDESVMGGAKGEVSLPHELLVARNPRKPIPITLRHLLGLLLDQANLHCREENGVLIIEPPPAVETAPMKKTVP